MKTILVSTDFSTPAQNAVNYAAKLAENFNLRLIILNVYSAAVAGIEALPAIDSLSDNEKASEKMLDEMKHEIMAAHKITEVICLSRLGTVQDLITEIADIYKAEAIVMGITGSAGTIKEKVIGSTTLDIARDSDKLLFIIPEGVEYKKPQKISFACDIDNLYGSRVLENVKEICNEFSAELEVVNIEKPGMEDEPLRIRNKHFMESNLIDIKFTTTIINQSDSHEALPDYFVKTKPDLILLNPKKQNFIQSIFHKSMTKTMAFHVKVPMLIVH